MTTPESAPPGEQENHLGLREIYAAVNQHWAHAEQTRWWLLYDFLMANSILVLAWVALFATQQDPSLRKLLLFLLCGAGLLLSVLWLALSLRANSFVEMYGRLGRSTEDRGSAIAGPFTSAHLHREGLSPWWRHVYSSHVLTAIPIIFFAVYALLAKASWCL